MKVGYAHTAAIDLAEIADWIAADNPARAVTFVAELQAACERIGLNPRATPIVPRYGSEHIRRRVYRKYLIFYRVEPKRVVILHILHGARDHDRIVRGKTN